MVGQPSDQETQVKPVSFTCSILACIFPDKNQVWYLGVTNMYAKLGAYSIRTFLSRVDPQN